MVDTLKRLEHEGYHFEAADASLELLMRSAAGWQQDYFRVESFKVVVSHRSGDDCRRGTTSRRRRDRRHRQDVGRRRAPHRQRRGQRPGQRPRPSVAQRHRAARIRSLADVHLTDFKVRVLDTDKGTGAVTRVLFDSTNGERTWTTIGVSSNIIEASGRRCSTRSSTACSTRQTWTSDSWLPPSTSPRRPPTGRACRGSRPTTCRAWTLEPPGRGANERQPKGATPRLPGPRPGVRPRAGQRFLDRLQLGLGRTPPTPWPVPSAWPPAGRRSSGGRPPCTT